MAGKGANAEYKVVIVTSHEAVMPVQLAAFDRDAIPSLVFEVGIHSKTNVPVFSTVLYKFPQGWYLRPRARGITEEKAFFEKFGRHAWEELSIHLARWHKAAGSPHLDYEQLQGAASRLLNVFPKGFMRPRYADMEPLLETPPSLLRMKKPYGRPKIGRMSKREAEAAAALSGKWHSPAQRRQPRRK